MIGCNERNVSKQFNQEIKVSNGLKLSKTADSLFSMYVNTIPTAPAYAIFIDKKAGTREYMLTFAPFYSVVKNMYESGAVNYFMLTDSIPVFLYTGLEDFVVSDSPTFIKAKAISHNMPENGEFKDSDPISTKIDFTKSWSYIRLDTVSYIVKGNSYPFTGSLIIKPSVRFTSPDSTILK